MIVHRPDSWSKDPSLDMLWLFYQSTDELLSNSSADTYMLPLHNSITLMFELREIYHLLKKYNIVNTYYKSYISPIIEEFLDTTEDDYILKKILGARLDRIRTGFSESIDNSAVLERWIGVFTQACTPQKYLQQYAEEIKYLILKTNDKGKLLYCIKNYYVSLRKYGYAREYLYICSKRYFNNSQRRIESLSQICDYIDAFNCEPRKHTFLILMNTEVIDYLEGISDRIHINMKIQKVDVNKELKNLQSERKVADLISDYEKRKHHALKHERFEIVKYEAYAPDPYQAIKNLTDTINFLQTFKRYFIHFAAEKQVYKMLFKTENEIYTEFRMPSFLQKRPYVELPTIDRRIENIVAEKALSTEVVETLSRAFDMHSEALDAKSISTMVRTFWTALETLFLNPSTNNERDNVIVSMCEIIQKTYLLKLTRLLYAQLKSSVDSEELNRLGITTYSEFVVYFSSNEFNSPAMKEIYSMLSENILLRSRLYNMRKEFLDGEHILKYLEKHDKRIKWQLKRVYRARNILTHIGHEVDDLEVIVNHLHSYFDYVVNYMLCKSENDDLIMSVSALIMETKTDNQIHHEMLKSREKLSAATYQKYLYGPDPNLASYKFEF